MSSQQHPQQRLKKMPIFRCCFCFQQFDNASGLGNHQWRCVPVVNNDVSLFPTNNNNIEPSSSQQSHVSNEAHCNILEDNDNLFMLAEGYDDDEIDDEEFYVHALDVAVADKYDTINLFDDDWDESSVESEQTMDTNGDNSTTITTKDVIMETISSSSLLDYQCFTEMNKAMGTLSRNMVVAIELLSLLRTSGCSLSLYDKIKFWVEESIPHTMAESLPTRDNIIKVLEERYHTKCMKPEPKKVVLPSMNLPIEIPVNPMLGCIYSLLSDENLMTSSNLIFPDCTQPWNTIPFGDTYSEINTGLAYQSFQKRIKHFGNAVQIPLIFFIDGTAIDCACQHSQTPVMFTLGIFKQALRNRSKAWRNLGFIKSNVKEQYSQQDIDVATNKTKKYPKSHECYEPDKHKDFHTQLRCIINDLLRMQREKEESNGYLLSMAKRRKSVMFSSLLFFCWRHNGT